MPLAVGRDARERCGTGKRRAAARASPLRGTCLFAMVGPYERRERSVSHDVEEPTALA